MVLFSSANKLLEATVHYSPVGWPSKEILSSIANQKADTLASMLFVALALISQMLPTFIKSDIHFPLSMKSVSVSVICLIVICVVIYGIKVGFGKSWEMDLKKQAAKDYVRLAVEEMSCPLYEDIESIAQQYFEYKKDPKETNENFLKRFAEYLKYDLRPDVNLSKFK
jgi:hypothetical protein